MTADEIAEMPCELRDAGSEGQTLKQAWETCEKSADLIEDLIAQLATERQARDAQAAEIARLQKALKPFSEALDCWDEDWPATANNIGVPGDSMDLTKQDFMNARAAIAILEKQP